MISTSYWIFVGVIFSLLFVRVCACVCQWTKFQLIEGTHFDDVFDDWLAWTLLKLVTFGQRSRWLKSIWKWFWKFLKNSNMYLWILKIKFISIFLMFLFSTHVFIYVELLESFKYFEVFMNKKKLSWLLILHYLDIDQMTNHVFCFTPSQNGRGIRFSLQFVCVSVCQWTEFQLNGCTSVDVVSLNGCLPHRPYWNLWPLVKGQGHSDAISIFSL